MISKFNLDKKMDKKKIHKYFKGVQKGYYNDLKRKLSHNNKFISGYSRTMKEINDFSKHITMGGEKRGEKRKSAGKGKQ